MLEASMGTCMIQVHKMLSCLLLIHVHFMSSFIFNKVMTEAFCVFITSICLLSIEFYSVFILWHTT